MTPNRFLTPSVVDEVNQHHEPGNVLRYGPMVFIMLAVAAIVVLILITLTALSSLEDVVQEERCRGEQRDQFFVEIIHASSLPPAEADVKIHEAVEIVERIPETCGFSEEGG